MELVSVGNVVTILVVVAILTIYRQLDRSNRSLEKVKRYSDRVIDNLGSFVEQRTAEMKDLSIEMQVNLKTGREVLKRIKSVEEGLANRAQQVDAIRQRLDDYDHSLGELVRMSSSVDENLKRLRDESQYASQLTKQVRLVGQQVATLEREVPKARAELHEQDRKAVAQLRDEALQATEKGLTALHARAGELERRVTDLAAAAAGLEAQREETLENVVVGLRQAGESLAAAARVDHERAHAALEERSAAIASELQTVGSRAAAEVARSAVEVEERLERGRAKAGEVMARFEHAAEELAQRYRGELESGRIALERVLDRGAEAQDELLTELERRLRADQEKLQGQITRFEEQLRLVESTGDQLDSRFGALSLEIGRLVDGVRAGAAKAATEANDQFLAVVEREAEQRRQELDRLRSDFTERLALATEDVESQVVARLEGRLEEYESEIGYRIRRLEEVNKDIDAIAASLTSEMQKRERGVKDEFTVFLGELATQRDADRAAAEKEVARVRGEMEQLDLGLHELKAAAYQGVSEKLKVFEDEFFSDLNERGAAMERRLESWQAEVANELAAIGRDQAAVREISEKRAADELRAALDLLRRNTAEEMQRIEAGVSGFQGTVAEQLEAGEAEIERLTDETRQSIELARQESGRIFDRSFADYRDLVSGDLRRLREEQETKIGEVGKLAETARRSAGALVDDVRNEMERWKADTMQLLERSRKATRDDTSLLEAEVEQRIREISVAFSSQRDQLIGATEEERRQLHAELKELGERVTTLADELDRKTEEARAAFELGIGKFQQELGRKIGEFSDDVDRRVRDFRQFADSLKQQTEGVRLGLSQKIEDNFRAHEAVVKEMDKKIQDFVAQTKIFERADALRVALEGRVEEIQERMDKLQTQRKELHELEVDLGKVRKIGDEATAKLARFMAERRRLQSMEDNFKRLVGLSQEIDVKLDNVYETSDTLQQIQAKIRDLQEMEKNVVADYERLEKKRELIEATTTGVDRNFQTLARLEKDLGSLAPGISSFSERINDLEGKITTLADNKERAEFVIQKIEDIDAVLENLEDRMRKLDTARDWLARTETRLQEVGKQAQEQVKLLETLIKAEKEDGKPQTGAPPLSKRDTVIKLAHLGWSIPEIAKVTKLSRGEVELILEVAPKR